MSKKFALWMTVLPLWLSVNINECLSQQYNIFNAVVPAHKVASGTYSASHAITLGTKFWSSQSGTISGIRFYRGATSPLGYVARLYSADGSQLLGSVTMTTESAPVPGWQTALFPSPIPISPNTTYVAAYYAPSGQYAYTNNGLNNGLASSPLTAPASSAVGGNGVFSFGLAFPRQTYQATNYFADVLFTPAGSGPIACDIGPAYTGAVPAAAQTVGFTHCAANYDFSNSFYATQSNWLDCAGAANPQWWNLSYSQGAVAPCSRYNIIPDPAFGTNVLQSIYEPSDWPNELSTELDTTNSLSPTPGTNPGFFFATQFYVDVAEYVTADTQNNAYAGTSCGFSPALFGGVWTWAVPETVETDFMEFYPGLNTCSNGGNTYDHKSGGALVPVNVNAQPGRLIFSSGYDPTIPHTYGTLQTANGTIYTRCNYMDGIQLGSGCVSGTFGSGAVTAKSWLKITMGPENNGAGSQPAVNEDLRVQRITIWECPGYQTGHC